MIIYKSYFKIIKKCLPTIIMYMGIFMLVATINMSNMSKGNSSTAFSSEKMNVAIVDRDKSPLSENLSKYISDNNDTVELEDSESARIDALFYRAAEYIVIIPHGFQQDFLAGKDAKISRMQVPGSYSGYYVDNMIDKYMNIANIYCIGLDSDVDSMITHLNENLKQTVNVTMIADKDKDVSRSSQKYFMVNFLAYTILAILVSVVGMVMISFNEEKIKKRTEVSPTSPISIARKQIVCNAVLTLIIVLLNILLLYIIIGEEMSGLRGVFYSINIICLGLVALSIAYFITAFIRSRNGQSAASNVIALGSSFLCGIFVPMEYLGDSVKAIGSCLPPYYYVQGNKAISELENVTWAEAGNAFSYMGIQLLFALGIFIITFIIIKIKEKKAMH